MRTPGGGRSEPDLDRRVDRHLSRRRWGGGGGGGGTADALAPTAPPGLAKSSSTQTSINVTWTAVDDNVGVLGYGLYRGGSTRGLLVCDVDSPSPGSPVARPTRSPSTRTTPPATASRATTISAATSACSGGGDTSAPTVPGRAQKTGSTTTSISVSWSASTDNVGVTGYGLYRNSSSTGSTSSTSSTFSGLVCGTSYTLSVDAYDAAGNRSTQAN